MYLRYSVSTYGNIETSDPVFRFESMSLYEMGTEITMDNMNPKMSESQLAMECTVPMGVTSENVAERYGITREDQDTMAMDSHAKWVQLPIISRYKVSFSMREPDVCKVPVRDIETSFFKKKY